MQIYKVVEVSPVDDSRLEEQLNIWSQRGWALERLEFVQQPGVRRPTMAYLFFVKRVVRTETNSGVNSAKEEPPTGTDEEHPIDTPKDEGSA